MLLDRTATANLKPELEIYADDVKCAHGATVGELDRMQQFYMAARGLPPAEAKRLLLTAFVADALGGDEALEQHAIAALEAVTCG
jgi:Fe-S cluster assembly protein SufD